MNLNLVLWYFAFTQTKRTKMKLIKKLETRRDRLGYITRWGLFLCPSCDSQIEKKMYNGVKCKTCSSDCGNACRSPRTPIHGDAKEGKQSRLYRIWADMKKRCYNENHESYKCYGAKDIRVCVEWSDYRNFKKWALGNGYESHLTIDRINSGKNYEPENCQWLTKHENSIKGKPQFSIREKIEIRKIYFMNKFTQLRIADAYDVSRSYINSIVNHRTYKY